jgi:hypothetical protein
MFYCLKVSASYLEITNLVLRVLSKTQSIIISFVVGLNVPTPSIITSLVPTKPFCFGTIIELSLQLK